MESSLASTSNGFSSAVQFVTVKVKAVPLSSVHSNDWMGNFRAACGRSTLSSGCKRIHSYTAFAWSASFSERKVSRMLPLSMVAL